MFYPQIDKSSVSQLDSEEETTVSPLFSALLHDDFRIVLSKEKILKHKFGVYGEYIFKFETYI